MKRGTPNHPKTYHLAEILNQRIPTAVGLLELLWHFTSEYAPQGDIGRYPDARIEAACHWWGRRGALMKAFVEAHWVDENTLHRLVVHDWGDHADKIVKQKLHRANQGFLADTAKVKTDSSFTDGTCQAKPSQAIAKPHSSSEKSSEEEPERVSKNGGFKKTRQALIDGWGASPTLVDRIVHQARSEYPDLTDDELMNVLRKTQRRGQTSPGLFEKTVPEYIRKHVRRGGTA